MTDGQWVMAGICTVVMGPVVIAFLVWWLRMFWEVIKIAWDQ